MATTIEYDSKRIATLDNGQTATLKCAGKKAITDIIVPLSGNGTITYNGTETVVEAGKIAYLSCAGKKLLTDVIVTSSCVTNLTGTTWRLPRGWECDAGVGKFSIEGDCQWKHIDANSPGLTSPVRFWLGYNSDGDAVANCFTTYTASTGGVTGVYTLGNLCEILEFAITGGEDVTNPTLINWLYKYSQPALPTIINGVWVLNSYEDLALGDQSVSQDINYTIDGIDYDQIWYTIGSSWNTLYLRSDVDGASKTIYSDEPHNWKRLELDFGDAPQVVSDKFYAWFTANATKLV